MKKIVLPVVIFVLFAVISSHAGLLDTVVKEIGNAGPASNTADDATVASGLKEALSVGTEKAVNLVSRKDGYFANQAIKILMPTQIQKVAEVLKKVGYQKQVDDFVLSMNRAAEKAAPQAARFFGDAIKVMTIEDAQKILRGGNTSATDFFRSKTQDKIYNAFKPIIASTMNEVGVTKSYKDMMGKYETIPLMDKQSLDLDHYVTNKSLDGLFHMVGQEEKKIRTDPAARSTELLKTVFGK